MEYCHEERLGNIVEIDSARVFETRDEMADEMNRLLDRITELQQANEAILAHMELLKSRYPNSPWITEWAQALPPQTK